MAEQIEFFWLTRVSPNKSNVFKQVTEPLAAHLRVSAVILHGIDLNIPNIL